jgi:hypothetical protein
MLGTVEAEASVRGANGSEWTGYGKTIKQIKSFFSTTGGMVGNFVTQKHVKAGSELLSSLY